MNTNKKKYNEYMRKYNKEWGRKHPWYSTATSAAYRVKVILHPNAVPVWNDKKAIRDIYEQVYHLNEHNKSIGIGRRFVVDHIFPILGKTVCGLHVLDNLQIIEQTLNKKKHARVPEGRKWFDGERFYFY